MIDPDAVLSLTDEEASALFAALRRREVMRDAERRIEAVSEEYLAARDGHTPDPATATIEDYPTYVTPTGAHNVYPQGHIIRWDEKLYRAVRSGVAHNPTEAPGEWQEVFLEGGEITTERPVNPDTGEPDWPAWDPGASYRRGSEPIKVVHKNRLWELIHTNSDPGWEPGTLPSVWADRGPLDNP